MDIYAKLTTKILLSAFQDCRSKNEVIRQDAINWLQSEDCQFYLDYLDIEVDTNKMADVIERIKNQNGYTLKASTYINRTKEQKQQDIL